MAMASALVPAAATPRLTPGPSRSPTLAIMQRACLNYANCVVGKKNDGSSPNDKSMLALDVPAVKFGLFELDLCKFSLIDWYCD